jgi:hypothetical protein
MNWKQFKKNLGWQYQLEPISCYLDNHGHELSEINDDWELTEVTNTDAFRLRSTRTGHETLLRKDLVYDFRSNPNRDTGDTRHGFLILKVQIFIQNEKIWLRPNSRPGEKVGINNPKKKAPNWTEYQKVDAQSAVPVTAKTAKIQFRLWCENEKIPLLIRIASDRNKKFSEEASGPSGVINLLLTEFQTLYVSVSDPAIQYEISVTGFSL